MNIYTFDNLFIGTAQKQYVKNAIYEIESLIPGTKVVHRYPEGIFVFETPSSGKDFIGALRENPPIFLRHIHPVNSMFFIPNDASTPDAVIDGIASLEHRINQGWKIAIQARRIPGDYDFTLFTIKKNIDEVLKNRYGAVPIVQRPDLIISVYIADSLNMDYRKSLTCADGSCSDESLTPWKQICLMGISNPSENLCEWSGGEVRFGREPQQKSRAEFKLLEAFEVFNIQPKQFGYALDLGSSPGGWARILHQKGYRVTAVDRAPLDREVESLEGVRSIKKDAAYFRDNDNSYDIITNDMNREPVDSAKILVSLSKTLKLGSPFIMTIKLPGPKPEIIIKKVTNILNERYVIKGIRQLYHNRDEVTVWGTGR